MLLELLVDDKAVFLVAHQHRRLHAVEAQALEGLLEQRVAAGEGEELLGIVLTRQRPESGTATA
jgi:hypothetical protein